MPDIPNENNNNISNNIHSDKEKSALTILKNAHETHKEKDSINLYELMTSMQNGGFGIMFFIFSVLTIIPIPPPIPSMAGIPIAFFAIQMAMGQKYPILPKFLKKFSISRKVLITIIEKSIPVLYKIEKLLRTRLDFSNYDTGKIICGIAILLISIPIVLPLPMSNFIPAIGSVLISLGLMKGDGLMIIFGMIVGFAGIALTICIIILGKEATMALLKIIF